MDLISINTTGLPQYGKKRHGLRKLVHKGKKALSHVTHNPLVQALLPVAGAVGGNFLLPGIGGVIGGGAAGAISNKKPLKGLLGGAAMGALQGYGMPLLGKGLTNAGMPMLGQGFQQLGRSQLGTGLSSIMGGLGLGGTAAAGGAGAAGAAGASAVGAAAKEGAASKGSGLSDLLLPLAIMGILKKKGKIQNAKGST